MKSIEEVIDNIVDEHKECRWMDARDLREYLVEVAKAQKSIDIERAIKGHCRLCDYYSCCPFNFEGCYERGEIFKAMVE